MKKGKIYILVLSAALLFNLNATAKIHTVIAGFSSMAANATAQVYDPRTFYNHILEHTPIIVSPGYKRWTSGSTTWHDVALKNRLMFYIKPEENCANKPFTATVVVELKVYNYHNNVAYTFQTINKTLTINYTPADIYSKKVLFELDGGYKTEGRIVSITSSNVAYNSALALDLEYEVESYVQFNPTNDFPLELKDVSQEQTKSEYQISWQQTAWAESYDLEWTFIDYYASFIDKGNLNNSTIPANVFQFNSTRINTTATSFSIPAVYGKGYILYRIRGVGKSVADGFKADVVSRWTHDFMTPTSIAAFKYITSDGLQQNLNWQFSTVFAEEGKNKVSVKYYDGTLRERQAVSKMNTGINMLNQTTGVYDKEVRTSIVAENIYDHQGRPAINVLPVPTDKETLRFYNGFNLNNAEEDPEPYDKYNFDIDRGDPCAIQTEEMSTTSGAANYYSVGNVFLTSQAHPATNKTASFIPSAAGYPFVQTLFMPDNTGKVKAKSGAGPDFQIGSGKETKYFYGRPFQEELDRLFAADAGYAEHYKKNVTQDPNGQLSISYMNLQDKVVATSLIGPKPNNVDKLDTKPETNPTVEVDLLNKIKTTDNVGKAEELNLNNRTRVLSQDFFVADEGIRNFTYKLINEGFQKSCSTSASVSLNFCYECVLDLKISLKNECGVEFLSGIGDANATTRLIDRTNVLNSTAQTLTNNCDAPETIVKGTSNSYWQTNQAGAPTSLARGAYTLNKVLTVNQTALDKYTQLFLKSNTCLTEKRNQFIAQEKAKMDTTMCNFDCTKWLQKLGSTYAASPLKTSISEEEWTKLYFQYSEQCNEADFACKGGYNSMIADMSPMGQYGELYTQPAAINSNGVLTELNTQTFSPYSFPLSVYNERNVLPWKKSIDDIFGAPGYKPNWRFPYNPDATGSKRFNYLNEFGEIDYVYITRDAQGVFQPQIGEENYEMIVTEADGRTKILVKYLLDVKQFVELWKPSWAKSLVAYHPEYPFYEQCKNRAASNAFDDSWLNTLTTTGTDGANAKFNGNSSLKRWLYPAGETIVEDGVTNTYPILDPFMSMLNTLNSPALTSVRNKINQFMKKGNSTTEFLTIHEAAVIIANNPSIDITTCGNSKITAILNQYGPIDSPEEWAVYRQLYMSLKQQVLEAYSVQQSILGGYYNGAIGVENFNAFNFWFYHTPFLPTNSKVTYSGFEYTVIANTQFCNLEQPCNYNRYWLYKNKTARYPQTKILYELDQLKNNNLNYPTSFAGTNLADFLNFDERNTEAIVKESQKVVEPAMYNNNCGQCPVAESMVQFLNSLITADQLIPSSPLTVFGGCDLTKPTNKAISDELLIRLAGAKLTNTQHLQYSATNTSNQFTITFKVMEGSLEVRSKSITFTLPAGYTPNHITQFCCVKGNATSGNHDNFNFTVSAFVKPMSTDAYTTANGVGFMNELEDAEKIPLSEVNISGATNDINLINCYIQPLCKPSPEAKQIPILFNSLLHTVPSYAGNPNKLISSAPVQVSLIRNPNGQLNFTAPAHQFMFTDALAKALIVGKFDRYLTAYYWNVVSESTISTNRILTGKFTFGTGLTPQPNPAPNHVVTLSFSTSGLDPNITFSNILMFNGIEPLLGYPNKAILKAIIDDNGTRKLIDVTITFAADFNTGNCAVGLPVDLESGQAANTKGIKVKPDIGKTSDYGLLEFNPNNPSIIEVDKNKPEDCTTFEGIRNVLLSTVEYNTNVYEQIEAGTAAKTWGVTSNGMSTFNYDNINTLPLPPGCNSDCSYQVKYPSLHKPDGTLYTAFDYTSVLSFEQTGPKTYEAEVTTRQGIVLTIIFEMGNCTLPPSPPNTGNGNGGGDGDGNCKNTDNLNFHNFTLYINKIDSPLKWVENITDINDPDYPFRNSWKKPEGNVYFMDGYNNGFTSGLDSFVNYRLKPLDYPLPVGKYSLIPLPHNVTGGRNWDIEAHYGKNKKSAMIYRLPTTGTWHKVWASTKTMPTGKGMIFKMVVWHKSVGFNNANNLDALKLRFYLNGVQTSVMAAEYKTIDGKSWTKYEMLYIPTANTPSISNTFEIFANTSDINIGGLLSDITVVGGCKMANCCPVPMPEVTRINPCNQQLMDIATENAEMRYAEEVRKATIEFQQNYIAKCLNVYEEFLMRYQDSEDQTTLYYYDQAGNLVRTVPPKGVVKITNTAQLAKIKQDRAAGLRTEFTQHNFKTTYAYNSLNQLVNQSTPDNETMNIWQAESKRDGIPSTYTITAIKFTDKRNGVLTANDGTNGHIYRTTNAGESWTEINAFGLPDINSAIEYFGNHFVVGNNGLIMHKLWGKADGEWDIRSLPTSAKLIKVSVYQFVQNASDHVFKLWVIEENGRAWLVNCKVNTTTTPSNTLLEWSHTGPYTNLSEQLDEPLTDISIPTDPRVTLTYPFKAFAVTGAGRIYVSNDYGFTWENVGLNRFVEENLSTLHVTTDGTAYIGGVNGVLLKGGVASGTAQLPARWAIIPNNLQGNITKLHFIDKDKGFALCTDKKLYRTTNGGLQFNAVSIASGVITHVVDMSFADNNIGTLVTEGGNVYITVNAGATWQLYGTSAVAIAGTTVFTGNKKTRKIRCVKNGLDLHVLVIGTEGINTPHLIYYSKQAATAAQNWVAITATPNQADVIEDVYMAFDGISLKAHLLTSSSAIGNIKTLINIQTPAAASLEPNSINDGNSSESRFNASKMFFTAINKAAFIAPVAKQLKRLDGTTWSTFTWDFTWNVNAFAVSPNYNNALFIGDAGEINAVEGLNGAGSAPTISVKKGVLMPPLNAVSASELNMVAAGNNGWAVFAMQNGANQSIKLKKSSTNQHLRAAQLLSNGAFTLAGNSNTKVTGTINTSSFAVTNSTNTVGASATDYRAILGTALAGTSGIVSAATGSPFTTPITANSILCGFDDGATKMVAGQNGFVAFATGTTFTQANTIAPLQLNEVFFVDTRIGYAGGENGSFWKTKDGGLTWKPMHIDDMANSNKDIRAIHFIDEYTGFVTGEGGDIYKTTTAGASFTEAYNGTGNLNDIEMHPSGTGYAVGDGGVCLRTTDGGNTWATYSISAAAGSNKLNAVSVPDYNVAYISGDNSLVVKIDILQTIPVSKLAFASNQSWPNYLFAQAGNAGQERNLNEVYFTDRQTGYAMGANGFLMKTTDGGSIWSAEKSNTTANILAFAPVEGSTFFATGSSGTAMRINDQKDRFASRFYYDALGRLVVSQNAKQYNKLKPGQTIPSRLFYSYTLFDFKGRITEVGEIYANNPMEDNYNAEGVLDDTKFQIWIAFGEKTEVTRTYYDAPAFAEKLNTIDFIQQNLRNRVASTAYYPVFDYVNAAYTSASHYTYDIHGNVFALIQENTRLAEVGHQFKRLDYTYDLVSGKVLEVAYQHNKPDRFYHRYSYDGDNRITAVKTSYDKVVWETDAKYQYYLHGPLARTELGHDQVQGLDYAYTLQGWLKSVNGSNLDVEATNTMGRDGVLEANNANAYFAKDEMAFELKYYNNDYTPVNPTASGSFASISTAYQTDLNGRQLYNGNISGMITAQRKMLQTGKTTLATAYSYDQLNRLAKAEYYTGGTPTNWAKIDDYKNTFVYDANGNIKKQVRNGDQATGLDLDDLTYNYYEGTNKLKGVNDTKATALYDDDIDNQNTSGANYNYKYDELGNLIEDKAEEIASITWNLSGKITRITRVANSIKPDLEFEYDPAGNRILKTVIPKVGDKFKRYTFYVRDAQGNIMATYTREYKRDINYSALTYEGINNQLIAMNGATGFSNFINWLHVQNDNNNNSFITQTNTAINSLSNTEKQALLTASSAHATEMLRNVGGLYTQTIATYGADVVAQTILTNVNIKNTVEQLCNCYATQHASNASIPDFALYFFNNNTTFGEYGKRELFVRWMFDQNNTNGELLNFAYALGYQGDLDNVEAMADFLVSVTDQGLWVSKFNDVFTCEHIGDKFAESFNNDNYGQGVMEYLGSTFSGLPDIKALLTQSSPSGCSVSYPDQNTASAYFGARSDIMSTLFAITGYHSSMFNWLISNRTSHTLNWLALQTPAVIQQAQTNANPYGSIENYFNLIKQHYGEAFYNNLFTHYATMAPAFRDLVSVNEQHIYGSSRLGTYKAEINLSDVKFTATLNNGNFSNIAILNVTNMSTPIGTYNITRGRKQFELSNHLGNVLAVVSDKKRAICGVQTWYNETFSGTTGSWTAASGATLVHEANKLKVTNTTSLAQVTGPQINNLTIGKKYVLTLELDKGTTASGVNAHLTWNTTNLFIANLNITGLTTYNLEFTAQSTRIRVQLQGTGATAVYYADAITVKEAAEDAGTYQSSVADVLQTNDYSPFGAPLPGRTYQQGKFDAKVVNLVQGSVSTTGWTTIFCNTSGCTSPESSVTLSTVSGKLRMQTNKKYAQAYYTFTTVPGRVYKVKYRLSGVTFGLTNTSIFAPAQPKELYTSANLSIAMVNNVDREMIFTATEASVRFYITRGWAPTDFTATVEEVSLDYLNITEVPSQVNTISCTSINENMVMLANSGVNTADMNAVTTYLNSYYNRTYTAAEYQAILSHCTDLPASYVLAAAGAEAASVKASFAYGFNGMLKDDDMHGEGNAYDFNARLYNSRLGVFLGVDPLVRKYPFQSPYSAFNLNPIIFVDPSGMGGDYYGEYQKNPKTGKTELVITGYVDTGKESANRLFIKDPKANDKTENRIEHDGGYYQMEMIPSDWYTSEEKGFAWGNNQYDKDRAEWLYGSGQDFSDKDFFERWGEDLSDHSFLEDGVGIVLKAVKPAGALLGIAKKLMPYKNAKGDHSTFERGTNGKVYKYETYEKTSTGHFNPKKRYDGGKPDGTPGAPHRNKKTGKDVPTPHVQGKSIPGGVRAADPNEIPK